MPYKNGFSLMEIVVVLVIIGVLAVTALPNYLSMMYQGAATAAQNNLISIYNAEKNNYLSSNAYYVSAACPDTANINTNLSLHIVDSNYTYCCNNTGGFQCTATSTSASGITLTLNNNSIVLLGGAGCATTSGASCNPKCAPAASAYCPNN
jgi:MSHA pilin protein MshA